MKFFGLITLAIVEWFALSWTLMLALGALHNDLTPLIPAPGYWAVARIVLALVGVKAVRLFFKGIAKEVAK